VTCEVARLPLRDWPQCSVDDFGGIDATSGVSIPTRPTACAPRRAERLVATGQHGVKERGVVGEMPALTVGQVGLVLDCVDLPITSTHAEPIT
jgi:hypothetical protein